MTHPIDLVIADGSNVDKAAVRSEVKEHLRRTVADVAEVRNADLSGQFGGLYVRSLAANFNIDPGNLDPDDGVNTLTDLEDNRFVRVADSVVPTERIVTVAGPVVVAADDVDIIIIQKTIGEPTIVNLPAASLRTKPIQIVDGTGDAGNGTNTITLVPHTGDSVMATVNYQYVIDSNGGGITLRPRTDGTGWI